MFAVESSQPRFSYFFAHDISRIRKKTRDISRLYARVNPSLSRSTRGILSLKQKEELKIYAKLSHNTRYSETISRPARGCESDSSNRGDESGGWVIGGTPQKTFFSRNVLKEGCGESSRWTTDRVDCSTRARSQSWEVGRGEQRWYNYSRKIIYKFLKFLNN